MNPVIECRFFNGYKPCGRHTVCDSRCPHQDRVDGAQILLVHLGAQGAVVRSTALLKAIRQKFPRSHLTWLTSSPMHHLLEGNPLIDRVLPFSLESLLQLESYRFDVALVIDKSPIASGIVSRLQVDQKFGFVTDPIHGGTIPATAAAEELWHLGLSNQKKFFENSKSETQLLSEALELIPWRRDRYLLSMSDAEWVMVRQRKAEWRRLQEQPVVGINTGCGEAMPAKKWTVEFHRQVIQALLDRGLRNLVLLGGPSDSLRNQEIAKGLPVIQSETSQGIRDGSISVAAVDIVVTGDSLGMHLAIAWEKFTVAWFGPSCAHEIDLYDNGVKILADVGCGPCWKKSCDQTPMCYDRVSLEKILNAVEVGRQKWMKEKTANPVRANSFPPFFRRDLDHD